MKKKKNIAHIPSINSMTIIYANHKLSINRTTIQNTIDKHPINGMILLSATGKPSINRLTIISTNHKPAINGMTTISTINKHPENGMIILEKIY